MVIYILPLVATSCFIYFATSWMPLIACVRVIVPDVCNTIWAYERKCILNIDQPTERCEAAWQGAWEKFEAKQELF